jgi:hypothetical protein
MSFARVFSITACKKKQKQKKMFEQAELESFGSRILKIQHRSYYLRNKKLINTISMKVTRGCKLSSIVPILQLRQ